MRRSWLSCLALAGGLALLAGCDNNKKDEVALLTEENQTLRAQLEERNRALEAADAERRQQALRLADMERQARETPVVTTTEFITGFEGIEGVTTTVGAGEITASVEGDVLFDSGKTTLKTNAKRSLDRIAAVLNETWPNKAIVIQGHTDTDPIKRSGYKSNYHLGFERAYAVREYLISKGVSPSRIALASYGPNEPLSTKAKSRRVEVVVKQ